MYLTKLRKLNRPWLFVFIIALYACQMDEDLSLMTNEMGEALEEEEGTLNAERFRIGNLVYEETFEGSNPLVDWVWRQLSSSHSFKVASSPVFSGKKSGRFELRDSDPI